MALAAILFALGMAGVMVRRNLVFVLLSVEIMLNSAALNFVIFNKFVAPVSVDGQVMAIFAIAVAAAEAVVGMAIFVALFRHRATVDVNRMNSMRD